MAVKAKVEKDGILVPPIQRLDCIYDDEPLGFERDPLNETPKMQAQDPLEEIDIGNGSLKRPTYISANITPNLKEKLKDDPFKWNEEHQKAFDDIKNYLIKPPVLMPPSRNKAMKLGKPGNQSRWMTPSPLDRKTKANEAEPRAPPGFLVKLIKVRFGGLAYSYSLTQGSRMEQLGVTRKPPGWGSLNRRRSVYSFISEAVRSNTSTGVRWDYPGISWEPTWKALPTDRKRPGQSRRERGIFANFTSQ
ncbi:hypothetical protein QL285_075805 [Trifolium repens]|nr:hypothetical protein QL285_075805 [Trifolium repens]